MPELKNIKRIAIFLILVSLLAALYLDYHRVGNEQANKNVDILVDYDEVTTLARANNLSLDFLLAQFGQSGSTGVLIRERTIKDLSQNGDMLVKTASELNLLRNINPAFLPGVQLQDGYTYLISQNERDYQYILEQLHAKKKNVTTARQGESYIISLHLSLRELDKLGVGFPPKDIAIIDKSGLSIVPRVREWGSATSQSLQTLQKSLQSLPRLTLVTFNDEAIPALNNLPGLAEEVKELGVPVGTYEFFNQQGLSKLGYLLEQNIIRAHAISENDMLRLSPPQAVERYNLAVSERNIRVLYVRLFGVSNPDTALENSLSFIQEIKAGIEKEGYQVGQATTFATLPYSSLLVLIMGLGVIGAGLLLLSPVIPSSRWLLMLGMVGIIGWAGIFFASPTLARKAFALLAVILFPLLGTLGALREERRSLSQAVLQLLKMSAISIIGAVIMTGLLADKAFMLKLDGFSGVKLAHVAPVALLFLFLILRNKKSWFEVKKFIMAPVTYLYAAAGLFVLAALAVYVIRTGNEGAFLVSSWENTFREVLDRVMGVRPRTKEFILGHPLMLTVLYYGFDLRKSVFLLFGLIGQISLVNTYAHIHTPLLISLTRSVHGLWLGIILGILLILIVNYTLKWLTGRLWSE